jgi:hypothetical protein
MAMIRRFITSFTFALLVLALATVASAQEGKSYGLWGGAGFVKLLVEGAPGGSYSVDGGIDFIVRPDVRIGAEVGYLSFGSMVIGGGNYETSLSAVPVLGQITYDATSWEGVVPYLRGGAGLYHLRATDEGTEDDESFTENNFGFNIGGGIRIEGENTFSYAVELRYHLALRDIENWDIIEIFGRVIF